jgi:hypothetical protein
LRRCTLAWADLTCAAVDAAWLTKVSVSCWETALELDQSFVAVGLDAGVVGVGLRRCSGRPRPGRAAGRLRAGDFSEQRTLLHLRADVEVPVGEVAGGAGVDGRVGVGGDIAGKNELLNRIARLGREGDDRWRGEFVGALGQDFLSMRRGRMPRTPER